MISFETYFWLASKNSQIDLSSIEITSGLDKDCFSGQKIHWSGCKREKEVKNGRWGI